MAVIRNVSTLHKYYPPMPENKDKSITIELKCVSVEGLQKAVIEQRGLSPEKVRDYNHDFIGQHVGKIEGLEYEDGTKIETWADVVKNGPLDLYNWISTIVYDSNSLRSAEVKN